MGTSRVTAVTSTGSVKVLTHQFLYYAIARELVGQDSDEILAAALSDAQLFIEMMKFNTCMSDVMCTALDQVPSVLEGTYFKR